jgi:polyisoprenoid-binding protein YceI
VAVTAPTRWHDRWACGLAAILVAWVCMASAAEIDPLATRIGFTLKTRWGQTLQGRFPEPRGEVAELPDGRHQVRLQLPARAVEIVDHAAYTRLTRGNGFFDVDAYPVVEFESDAYAPELLRTGGALAGTLTIRDVHRREVFTIEPSACARPAYDCDVVARGTIHRTDYGMDRWDFALSEKVRFSLRVRVRNGNGA